MVRWAESGVIAMLACPFPLALLLLLAGTCHADPLPTPDVLGALRDSDEREGNAVHRARMREQLRLARRSGDRKQEALALYHLASNWYGVPDLTGNEDPVSLLEASRGLWEGLLRGQDPNAAWQDAGGSASWMLWSPGRDPIDWGHYEDVLERLATKLDERGRLDDSIEVTERLLALRAHRLVPGHLSVGRLHCEHASRLARAGRKDEARQALARAGAIYRTSGLLGDLQELERRTAEVEAAVPRPARAVGRIERFLSWLAGKSESRTALAPRPRNRRELLHLEHGVWVNHVVWSPRGDLIASQANGGEEGVRIWSARDGSRVATLPLGATAVDGLAFTPQGDEILVLTWSAVRRFRLPSGEEGPAIPAPCGEHGCPSRALALSPDGRWLAAAWGSASQVTGKIFVFEAATGAKARTLECGRSEVGSLSFDQEATLWAANGSDPIRAFELPRGGARSPWSNRSEPEMPVDLLAISPRGDVALVRSRSHTRRLRLVPSPDGEDWPLPAGFPSQPTAAAFTPDGARLVTTANDWSVRVHPLDPDAEPSDALELRGHGDVPTRIAISPDGTRAATAGADGRVIVWSLR